MYIHHGIFQYLNKWGRGCGAFNTWEAMICFAKKILQQVIEHILFTVCFAVKGETVKAYSDLDLTMPNIEFLRATFLNYTLSQFYVPTF